MSREKDFQPREAQRVTETIYKTSVRGLLYIDRPAHYDERGFFAEVANIPELEKVVGEPFVPAQVNCSESVTGVVRGLHAEGWNKLVFVPHGVVFCAFADIRPDSPTFGKVVSTYMGHSSMGHSGAFYIPMGVASSFCVVDGPASYVYLVDRQYEERDKALDRVISVFDPDLGIKWPISGELLILSDRDRAGKTMRECFPDKYPGRRS